MPNREWRIAPCIHTNKKKKREKRKKEEEIPTLRNKRITGEFSLCINHREEKFAIWSLIDGRLTEQQSLSLFALYAR